MPTITIHRPASASALEARPPLIVNGREFTYAFDTPIDLPEAVIAVARAAGLSTTNGEEPHSPASGDAGDGDAAAGAQPGGDDVGGSEINGDAGDEPVATFINGSVAQVAERLVNLTREQLLAVEAAELSAGQRKGVIAAIRNALKAFDPDA